VGRNPIHIQELVGPQAKEVQHQRRKARETVPEVSVQEVVQAAAEPKCAIGGLLDPSAVPIR
jgi:hypothetical protein